MASTNIRLFSSDLDGTLLGNPEAAWRFTRAWEGVRPSKRPLLVYNTGRTISDTRELVMTRRLPEPDFIIGGVGTELYDTLYNRADDFRQQFSEGWNLARVNEIVAAIPGVQPQPVEPTLPYKSSWLWVRARHEEIEDLRRRLGAAGIQAHIDYSCRYFLDVVPARAGKGRALRWLCQRLHIPLEHVLVAGDTANDTEMFLLPGVKGIVVENALPELLGQVIHENTFVARSAMADGVLEGLQHFGVIKELPTWAEVEAAPKLAR